MKKKNVPLLLLLFLLFLAVFLLPRLIGRHAAPTETPPAETPTETLEDRTYPYEPVWPETEPTESEEQTTSESVPGEPVRREKTVTDVIFASDIHYMSQSLTDYGQAFNELIDNSDGKMVRYMPQIWQAFAEEVIAAHPDALILSGDLTMNGEKANHQELAGRLAEIEEAGIQVLVIPGNHDINNPYATSYFGDEQSFIENVDQEGFWEIYRRFGYNEAADYAPDSLSYLYKLNETTWFLMLDTCIYTPENEEDGEIRSGTLEWIEKCLKDAYAQGITVIPVGHHNLQELSRVYTDRCVIRNHEKVLRLFERYLTPAYFSGHLHVQRILKHIAGPGVGDDVYGIWEIVSNSLIIPPCLYGRLTLNADGSLSFHTKNVDVSGWAAKHGETNPELLDFPAYSDSYIRSVISRQTFNEIEDMPDYIREELADFYADLYRDYYAGRPISYAEKRKEEGFQLWDRFMNPSILFRQVEGMMRDGMAVNGNAEIPNPIDLKHE